MLVFLLLAEQKSMIHSQSLMSRFEEYFSWKFHQTILDLARYIEAHGCITNMCRDRVKKNTWVGLG